MEWLFLNIGIFGAILLQGSTLLQIVKFIKSKKTEGVSIGFWWVIWTGLCCYLIYSTHIGDTLYTCSNTIGIVFTSISIALYYFYRKMNRNLCNKSVKQITIRCKCGEEIILKKEQSCLLVQFVEKCQIFYISLILMVQIILYVPTVRLSGIWG